MSAVWSMDLPTSDKMVMLALADWSNDDGHCWPSMTQLMAKTGLTDRALRTIVGRLKEAGHLTREERPGKGVFYTVHPGTEFPPEATSPRKQTAKTPERGSANTSITTKPPSEAKASSGAARATRRERFVPESWSPNDAHRAKAAEYGRDLDSEVEAFRQYEFSDPKSDFDRAFHRWLRNAGAFGPAKPAPVPTVNAAEAAALRARHEALLSGMPHAPAS